MFNGRFASINTCLYIKLENKLSELLLASALRQIVIAGNIHQNLILLVEFLLRSNWLDRCSQSGRVDGVSFGHSGLSARVAGFGWEP